MNEDTKQAALEAIARLENIEAHQTLVASDYHLKRTAILASVQDQLDALDVEYEPIMTALSAGIEQAREAVKASVIVHGETIKGAAVHAVYSPGRASWDDKILSGYAAAHPEILAARKVGAPSVSIRGAK